mmetsp:Transcript_23441/g.50812  ORF Transcript_23441/g.50812 Transcript_23441/m.50812 type:complete len:367 (-) Transcript_23441:173-1273(-)
MKSTPGATQPASNQSDQKETQTLKKLLAESNVPKSQFAQEEASEFLRVCCYGSSSHKTPKAYKLVGWELGYLLGKRGHTCVNGAGPFGCMDSINEGASAANGHIVGVIHKWLFVDGASADSEVNKGTPEDPCYGANPVFDSPQTVVTVYDGDGSKPYTLAPSNQTTNQKDKQGPYRELIITGGPDLQERKRLLVRGADVLVVLPGGPGTFDELWEMACARNLGLSKLPIICVNIDGYYEPFRAILERAWKDQLLKLKPSEIIIFASSAQEAVKWCENARNLAPPKVEIKKRKTDVLRNQSILGSPIVEDMPSPFPYLAKSMSWVSDTWNEGNETRVSAWTSSTCTLVLGVGLGYLLSESCRKKLSC